jgi:hypothetical protein
MTRWYIQVMKGTLGPFTPQELKARLASRELTPAHKVRYGEDGEWVDLSHLLGFFIDEEPAPHSPAHKEEKREMPKTTLSAGDLVGIVVSLAVIVALVASPFLAFRWSMMRRTETIERRDSANEQVVVLTRDAREKIDAQRWEEARKTLEEAIATDDATETSSAQELLMQVNEEIRQEPIRQAERAAAQLLKDAKSRIDSKEIDKAISLLKQYLAQPLGADKEEAQRLLREAEKATSETAIVEVLIAMDDENFESVRRSGKVAGSQVTHPTLNAIYQEALRRSIEKATKRRDEITLAALEREQKRQENEKAETQDQAKREAAEKTTQEMELIAKLRSQVQKHPDRSQELVNRQRSRDSVDSTPDVEDVANFPDRYIGKCVCFKMVKVHGSVSRDPALGNAFRIIINSRRNELFGYGDPAFPTSDSLATNLMHSLAANELYPDCNVYCEISKKDNRIRAHIYKIEVYRYPGVDRDFEKIFTE